MGGSRGVPSAPEGLERAGGAQSPRIPKVRCATLWRAAVTWHLVEPLALPEFGASWSERCEQRSTFRYNSSSSDSAILANALTLGPAHGRARGRAFAQELHLDAEALTLSTGRAL